MNLTFDLVRVGEKGYDQFLKIMEYVYKVPEETVTARLTAGDQFAAGAYDGDKLVGFIFYMDHKKALVNPDYSFVAHDIRDLLRADNLVIYTMNEIYWYGDPYEMDITCGPILDWTTNYLKDKGLRFSLMAVLGNPDDPNQAAVTALFEDRGFKRNQNEYVYYAMDTTMFPDVDDETAEQEVGEDIITRFVEEFDSPDFFERFADSYNIIFADGKSVMDGPGLEEMFLTGKLSPALSMVAEHQQSREVVAFLLGAPAAPGVLNITLIGVLPAYRRQHVALGNAPRLFKRVKQSGIMQLVFIINAKNLPPLKLLGEHFAALELNRKVTYIRVG